MDQKIIKSYLSERNMLITGGAGVGKSYYIRELRKLPNDKRVTYVTASTGIAAENVNGMTIHNYVGSQGFTSPKDAARVTKLQTFKDACGRICGTKVLIIDEVSMIRADYFELLNILLSRARANAEPFGGIKIVLVGDFMQLPPVYSDRDLLPYGKYVFETNAFKEGNFEIFNLKEVKRQDDENFIRILNNIRFGDIHDSDLDILKAQRSLEKPVYLTGLNREAETVNQRELEKLEAEPITLKTFFSYSSSLTDKQRIRYWQILKNEYKVQEDIILKPGAKVIITRNHDEGDYVNGSVGTFIEHGKYIKNIKKYERVIEYLEDELGRERREYYKLTDEDIAYFTLHWNRKFARNGKGEFSPRELCLIKLDTGMGVYVERFETEIRQTPLDEHDTDMELLASASYFPLKLAWAITTHKSQGMTLEEVDIDAKGFFTEGQFYVSLSRATTLDGLRVTGIDKNKIMVCSRARDFYKGLE